MDCTIAVLDTLNDDVAKASEIPLKELDEMQLALVGGGVGEITTY